MANPNLGGNVYKRGECGASGDLHEAWNAIIQKVNDERTDPPDGCDPLDEIPCVDPEHIWTKDDVQEVQDAIDEMCPGTVIFEPIPDYWDDSIIDEIETALEDPWGDCCEEECREDCINALPGDAEIFIDCGEYDVEECTEEFYPQDYDPAEEAGSNAKMAVYAWADLWVEYCNLQEEVEELEEELEDLEAIRDAICTQEPPDPPACEVAQADVDAKQAELDEKKVERDAKEAEAEAKLDEADAYAAESISLSRESAYPECMYYYVDDVLSISPVPWQDTAACELLGPDCWPLYRDPDRCRVSWAVQRKYFEDKKCGPDYEGTYQSFISGGFTPRGNPYVTSITFPGVPNYACSTSGSCLPPLPCEWETGCAAKYHYWVRVKLMYPKIVGQKCC